MDKLREVIKEHLSCKGVCALYVYGPEGVGKRHYIMDAIKKMDLEPVEVPLISTYTALGNFLKAVWDRIPQDDRSMYMGMLRGAVGRFFAHYVPTLAPDIEKMGIDLSRSIVNVEVVAPHIATILSEVGKSIVWVLNDYFALDSADLRKFVNILYTRDLSDDIDNIRIIFVSEVDDPKVKFHRVKVGRPSKDAFERVVGHRVSDREYELVDGNPGVYKVVYNLVKAVEKDLRMYSRVEDILSDTLTDRQKNMLSALVFVSAFHVGRFGPAMRMWASTLVEDWNEEDIRFLEDVGLVEKLTYLMNITGIPIWRVQYTLARKWLDGMENGQISHFIDKSVCLQSTRGINDAYFILSMHARAIGEDRRAHAYLIRWIKSLKEEYYLQRILEILGDLGYIENPSMLPKPAAAFILRFLYWYFGSHPSLKAFGDYLKDYIVKRPVSLALFVEFILLYGEVSSDEVDTILGILKEHLVKHRGYPSSIWVMWGIGRIYEEYNSYSTAEVHYREALSLASLTTVPQRLKLELINGLGRVLYLQGKGEEARQQWVKLLEEARASGDPVFMSKAYNNLAVYEMKRSFRYAMELFRLSYETAMGVGITSAAVSLSNYLSGAYEIITQDSYMERLVEAQKYITSIGVPFYTLLFYQQTLEPLIRYRNSPLVHQWEHFLRQFFDDEGRRKVYAERYVEFLASLALSKAFVDEDIEDALSILKEAEDFAEREVKSATAYISSIYEVYMEIGAFHMNKDIFLYGYNGMKALGRDISDEYVAVSVYFDGLVSHAVDMLISARRHYLRDGRKFKSGLISLYIAEIYYRKGDTDIALMHYRRALSEFEGLGVFQMISEIMNILQERGLQEKLFAGVSEASVEQSVADGSLGKLWAMFETVLDDVEREIFVYESVLEAYQRVMGKASVLEIAEALARSIRFFVSASTYVTIYRGDGKIGYGLSSLFPGGIFLPKVSEYSLLASGINGWYADEKYTVFITHKGDYSVLVYIDKGQISDIEGMFVESIVGLVLASLPMLAERQHAIVDTLTGLYVRWYALRRLDEEFARSRREGTPIGVLYMDIDNFKRVNDTYGHSEGDKVLRQVAQIIKHACGPLDVPGRYGGEEFLMVLPGASVSYAMDLAEKIRSEVEKTFENTMYKVTISIGVAVTPPLHARSGVELLDMADKAMYYAKRHGKNRVVFATEDVLREVK